MHVKELIIHNFRGIKDLHLILNSNHNVCVLVGVNGVGKSSILDSINLMMEFYSHVVEASLIESTHRRNKFTLPSDIYNASNYMSNQIKVSLDNGNEVDWEIVDFREWDEYEEDIYLLKRNKAAECIVENGREQLFNRYCYYLSNREMIDLTGTEKNNRKNIVDFRSFSKWFKETEDLENEQRLSENIEYRHPLLKAVRQAIYLVLGDDYDSLTFKRAIGKITIKKSGREIAIDLLSDGEKSLLAMVSHLARRLAEEYDFLGIELGASALVLIDEIELHLHPSWQRMIIPRLTQIFPNCQFIVTTHSPQVLSHVDPECIHILDYDGDNIVVKRPENSYGLDSNRILEDILGVPKRPQEIQDRMLELFRTINNNDLEQAKKIVEELGDRIGTSEPELIKAEATIKRREIIAR